MIFYGQLFWKKIDYPMREVESYFMQQHSTKSWTSNYFPFTVTSTYTPLNFFQICLRKFYIPSKKDFTFISFVHTFSMLPRLH